MSICLKGAMLEMKRKPREDITCYNLVCLLGNLLYRRGNDNSKTRRQHLDSNFTKIKSFYVYIILRTLQNLYRNNQVLVSDQALNMIFFEIPRTQKKMIQHT